MLRLYLLKKYKFDFLSDFIVRLGPIAYRRLRVIQKLIKKLHQKFRISIIFFRKKSVKITKKKVTRKSNKMV